MASAGKYVLYSEDAVAVGNPISPPKGLGQRDIDLIAVVRLDNAAGSTVDVVIEHSPDNVTWGTLATIPTQAGDGMKFLRVTDSAFGNVRADITVAGAIADVDVEIYYDKA